MYERPTKVRVSRCHMTLVFVLFSYGYVSAEYSVGMSKDADDIQRFVSKPVVKSAH